MCLSRASTTAKRSQCPTLQPAVVATYKSSKSVLLYPLQYAIHTCANIARRTHLPCAGLLRYIQTQPSRPIPHRTPLKPPRLGCAPSTSNGSEGTPVLNRSAPSRVGCAEPTARAARLRPTTTSRSSPNTFLHTLPATAKISNACAACAPQTTSDLHNTYTHKSNINTPGSQWQPAEGCGPASAGDFAAFLASPGRHARFQKRGINARASMGSTCLALGPGMPLIFTPSRDLPGRPNTLCKTKEGVLPPNQDRRIIQLDIKRSL